MSRWLRRLGVVAVLAGGLVATSAGAASAHPLGNFTVNQYAHLTVRSAGVDVRLIVDLAEIPTYQVRGQLDPDGNGTTSADEANAYAGAECPRQLAGVALSHDGQPVALELAAASVQLLPGSAGLPTSRLQCDLRTVERFDPRGELTWRNGNYEGRTGWREVTATADGLRLERSDVPVDSISRELTAYPQDLLTSPLDVRTASVLVTAGSGSAGAGVELANPTGRGQLDRFTALAADLVGRGDLGPGVAAIAILLALGLGAAHAFAPGHGKTIMAAYLVGERATLRQSAAIGLTVTATHTVGVLLLGVALSASSAVAPERVYPYLSVLSGLLVLAIGGNLLWRTGRLRWPGFGGHTHPDPIESADPHSHAHQHGDGDMAGSARVPRQQAPRHPAQAGAVMTMPSAAAATATAPSLAAHGSAPHSHGGRSHTHPTPAAGPVTARRLLAMGFAGGLVPSPSALVVLLGALAIGRAWFGVLLVTVYGVGMALMLTGVGLALARARGVLDRRASRRPVGSAPTVWGRLVAAMPTVMAGALVILGLATVVVGVRAL